MKELCFIPMAWVVWCALVCSRGIVKGFYLGWCCTAVDLSSRRGDIECVDIEGELTVGDRRHGGFVVSKG